MPHDPPRARGHRVVIAGAGVAGLESLIALRDLACERVQITVVAPTTDFQIEAAAVGEGFGRPAAEHYDIAELCASQSADFLQDVVVAVDADRRLVKTAGGHTLPYDSLVVALGATRHEAFPAAITYRGAQDTEAIQSLLDDANPPLPARVVFVVPSNLAWTLPLYELALMLAERTAEAGVDATLTVVTPEAEPLGVFGRHAAEAVAGALEDADIAVLTRAHVQAVTDGLVVAVPGDVRLPAERVIALPRLAGRRVAGLSTDPEGFLAVDDHCRVLGLEAVYAAGDGTSFAIKQGGIAAQQAETAARAIARRAGAGVPARPFRPKLQAKLYAGARDLYLREAITGGGGTYASQASTSELWWPPSKVVAPYLAAHLATR